MLLHSYHKGMLWADAITRGAEEVLEPDNVDLTLFVEYMDTKRHNDQAHLQQLKQLYRKKYKDIDLDLVITSDDNALQFALKHRDLLFFNTPIVFCGVNYLDPALLNKHKQITGVVEDFDVKSTLELGLDLHPMVQDVYIINDLTTTGLANKKILRAILPSFSDLNIKFHILDTLSMQQLRSKLFSLSDQSLVLLLSFNRDKTGQVFTYRESIELISSACQVPIYSVWAFYLNRGIVGGKLTSGRAQGRAAARLARQVLSGKSIQELNVIETSPNFYMFDYQKLRQFDIPLSKLPVQRTIINKPTTFYSEYKTLVLGSLGIFILLCAIIVSLVLNILYRKKAEAALQESENRYRTLVQNVPIGIFRSTPGPEGRFLMTNEFLRSMFGYSSDQEVKNIKISDLYVFPEKRAHYSDLLLQQGSISGVEILMQKKDNTQIWCSFTARVVNAADQENSAVYFDGSIENITKRKNAEDQLRKLNQELESRVLQRTRELENTNQILKKALSKLEEEEEAGKAIQFQLLPQEMTSIYGFDFSRFLLPSTYLSGDFTDYFDIDERYIGFYIADVSGHGISSAFVTVFLKSFMTRYLEKYLQENDQTILHTEVILKKLNKEIYDKNLDKYLTIFYAVIDTSENKLSYSNAAQFPYPILFNTQKSQFIATNNCPVGLFDFCTYTRQTIILPEQFVIFAASDGILHALEQTDLQEQQDYLLSLISHKDISVQSIARHFSLDKHDDFPDDITFLMVKRVN